ncbi:MAG: phage tail tape measure protein [Pseudomonadota bacterium]
MDEIIDNYSIRINANTAELRKDLREVSLLGDRFGKRLSKSFIDVAVKGKDLSSVFRSLALSLSNSLVNQSLQPFNRAIGGAFNSLFSGITGVGGGNSGSLIPFAKGGVLNGPAMFPLKGSGLGLAGEAGPEAILPLSRGSDGRLGVAAQNTAPNINVTFHITTQDAASFRETESQITAMLSRAVSRGSRNL